MRRAFELGEAPRHGQTWRANRTGRGAQRIEGPSSQQASRPASQQACTRGKGTPAASSDGLSPLALTVSLGTHVSLVESSQESQRFDSKKALLGLQTPDPCLLTSCLHVSMPPVRSPSSPHAYSRTIGSLEGIEGEKEGQCSIRGLLSVPRIQLLSNGQPLGHWVRRNCRQHVVSTDDDISVNNLVCIVGVEGLKRDTTIDLMNLRSPDGADGEKPQFPYSHQKSLVSLVVCRSGSACYYWELGLGGLESWRIGELESWRAGEHAELGVLGWWQPRAACRPGQTPAFRAARFEYDAQSYTTWALQAVDELTSSAVVNYDFVSGRRRCSPSNQHMHPEGLKVVAWLCSTSKLLRSKDECQRGTTPASCSM